jgi:P-type E1-E2 ATPase
LPKKAYLANGKSILVEDIKIGDILALRGGEMVQADGIVVKGQGVIDESALTGEATPLGYSFWIYL